ncbi:protein FAM204A isoform X1 [Chiroxiphia lanceolata]|uniref:protein FAM204A isoform X1 n=1 Tax=Chiroxiphia lanceolata TaxID=296741 RepID=UPI0013CE5CBB|nr:protein FAM204A isoform X1 [Chiroxiphia lanceolata]XP_032551154.1 protein FAM204A isoform X1 [Chiroxiphia lanceolata]
MWSGLLPPGVNESDVDLSSDGGDDSPASSSKKEAQEDTEGAELSELPGSGQESSASSEPVVIPVADEESESQTCPPGISVNIWNKFVELQKKHCEMQMEAEQENRCRKRKRHRKAKQKKADEVTKSSQQLENEEKWKELTQYFGINDRFESPVDSRAPQKSGLELSIEKCVAEGDIAKAEELSDRLAMRERWKNSFCLPRNADKKIFLQHLCRPHLCIFVCLGVKIAKAAACRNFVKAKQEAEAAQEAQKKKKLAWGFEAKKRWETKSNMGYM